MQGAQQGDVNGHHQFTSDEVAATLVKEDETVYSDSSSKPEHAIYAEAGEESLP